MNKIKKSISYIKQHPKRTIFTVGLGIGICMGYTWGKPHMDKQNLWLGLDKEMYTALVSGETNYIKYECSDGPAFLVTLQQ